MIQDLRYSLRALVKRPSFAAGTILVLGLAVGVNTAVFSLINALLLRPLPVPGPDEVVFIYHSNDRQAITYGSFRELEARVGVFTALTARSGDVGRLRAGADVLPLYGESVTANYFDVLGVVPKMGRAFHASEASPSQTPVAVISDALWKSHFAGDPQILGRTLRIDAGSITSAHYSNSRDYTIIGVAPPAFQGTGNPWQPAQYWVLMEQRFADIRAARGNRITLESHQAASPIGRLKPGTTMNTAGAAVHAAARDIISRLPWQTKPDDTFRVLPSRRIRLPFQGAYFMDMPRIVGTLGAVGTLLLIVAGANLAGMLLARGVARRSEIAIRLSLGVSRVRLTRQLLAESLLLAFAAGCAGLLIARLLILAALHGLPSQIPGSGGMAFAVDVPIDWRVIAFAFATGAATAVIVGLAPAVQAMRIDLLAALGGAAASTGRSRSRLRRLVLVPQVALALVLLLVTGLFVRAMLRIELAPAGFDPQQVVTIDVQWPQQQLDTPDQRSAAVAGMRVVQDRLLERVRALPGVSSAALVGATLDGLALANSITTIIARSDYETTRQYRGVRQGYVSKNYFATLGIRVLRGRDFDDRDAAEGATSVIVSERFANDVWPGRDPIGEQIAMHSPESRYPIQWCEVVGVAGSVTRPQEEFAWPVFYSPVERQPGMGTTFVIRGDGNPATLVAAAKQAIAAVDPTIIVAQARPLEQSVSDVRYPRRFTAAILGASGAAALLLSAIGVFALMSYAVAQRMAEIGVRMVLGARRQDVVRLILRDGASVVIAGIVIGFAFAFTAVRYAAHAIVPLPDADAITFVTVPLVLIAVVLLACYLPARRAARVDPLVVLRRT